MYEIKEAVGTLRSKEVKQFSVVASLSGAMCIFFSWMPERRLMCHCKNGKKFYVVPLKLLRIFFFLAFLFLNWELITLLCSNYSDEYLKIC